MIFELPKTDKQNHKKHSHPTEKIIQMLHAPYPTLSKICEGRVHRKSVSFGPAAAFFLPLNPEFKFPKTRNNIKPCLFNDAIYTLPVDTKIHNTYNIILVNAIKLPSIPLSAYIFVESVPI